MSAWVAWAAAASCCRGEIFTPGLFFLGPVALAAVAAAVAAVAGGAVWLQALVFVLGSFASLGLLRPIAGRTCRCRATCTGAAALEGASAVVLARVDGQGGRIRLAGEEWTARSYVPDEVFEPGAQVEVARIEGATALVYR